jgi:hypothetical protein
MSLLLWVERRRIGVYGRSLGILSRVRRSGAQKPQSRHKLVAHCQARIFLLYIHNSKTLYEISHTRRQRVNNHSGAYRISLLHIASIVVVDAINSRLMALRGI